MDSHLNFTNIPGQLPALLSTRLSNIFFNTLQIPKMVKASTIVLIPKGSHAYDISEFRTISLCNTFYNIISKIFTNMLKLLMNYINSLSQAGFINKRISTDYIIHASELLGEFKNNHNGSFSSASLIYKKHLTLFLEVSKAETERVFSSFYSWIKAYIKEIYFSICYNEGLKFFF
ncbi:hypothetical protein KFK09_019394 [Dendrobium nobile]|uniref:Reverse transcriptase domain-containing protein n=1 Tax=Dendrobium nobile TaxID=94219 RepID=A0A8T3APD9_DENNO|nr:hypothetical protein KFK09_019394 [Dendrobium nobile]